MLSNTLLSVFYASFVAVFAEPRIQEAPYLWNFPATDLDYPVVPSSYNGQSQKSPAATLLLLEAALSRGGIAGQDFDLPRMPSRLPHAPVGVVPKEERVLSDLPTFGDSTMGGKQGEPDFMQPSPGVAPKFTGSFKTPSEPHADETQGPIVNPAAFFLNGGNFDNVKAPKCRVHNCVGPLAREANVQMDMPKGKGCEQTFIPLNGCTDGKGYVMGMVCAICCDCSPSFVREMKKTRGYKQGFQDLN